MCRKLIVLISVAVLLGLVLTDVANAADPNLIGWWKLDEGSGTTTADSSNYGNDGTFGVDFNGLPDSNNAPQWVGGRRGEYALRFNRYDGEDFVTCGNDPNFDVNGPMTVMAWVKGPVADQKMTVVCKGGDSWTLFFPLYYREKWSYDLLNTDESLYTKEDIGWEWHTDGEWHHAAGTISRKPTGWHMEMFFDGTIIDTNDMNGVFSTDTNDLWIGGQCDLAVKGERYWHGFIDDVRIYDYNMTQAEIQAIYNEPYDIAHHPNPGDGAEVAVDLNGVFVMRWTESANAVNHNVYFGTSSTPPFIQNQGGNDNNSYEPNGVFEEGGVDFGGTYYWQIDENDAGTIYSSPVWSFSVADYLFVDDFESYYSNDELTAVWAKDGGGYVTLSSADEEQHEGERSMEFLYYCLTGLASYLEANNTYATAKDFTAGNMKAMTLYFLGTDTDNGADDLYVRLADDDGNSAMVFHPNNPTAILETAVWQEWNIDLQDFKYPAQAACNDVNLANIKHVVVGIGDPYGSAADAQGSVAFDDFKLYPSRCIFAEGPLGDMAGNTGDCKVDNKDLGVMSDDWLSENPGLILWYKLDDTNDSNIVDDSSGKGYDGTISDPNQFSSHGYINGCVDFGHKDHVDVPLEVLSSIRDEITVAFWANGNPNDPEPGEPEDDRSKDKKDCVLHAKYGLDSTAEVLCIYLPEPNDSDEELVWTAGNPDDGLADTIEYDDLENLTGQPHYRGQWNHYAVTKDADAGVMTVYVNGEPCTSAGGMYCKIYGAAAFEYKDKIYDYLRIGMKLGEVEHNHWYMWGRLDDFRIYDYVLSDADIKRLYSQQALQDQRGDFDSSGRVNFEDYAELGNSWLKEQLWP